MKSSMKADPEAIYTATLPSGRRVQARVRPGDRIGILSLETPAECLCCGANLMSTARLDRTNEIGTTLYVSCAVCDECYRFFDEEFQIRANYCG